MITTKNEKNWLNNDYNNIKKNNNNSGRKRNSFGKIRILKETIQMNVKMRYLGSSKKTVYERYYVKYERLVRFNIIAFIKKTFSYSYLKQITYQI